MAAVVLDNLAEDQRVDKILHSCPSLHPEDIRAAMAYAAELGRERMMPLATDVG